MDSSSRRQIRNPGHLPFWEPGSGYYGNTLGQYSRAVITNCQDLVLSFLDQVPVAKSFTVADYGTNDGYASMPLVESIIRHVKKKHGDTFPVQVIYEDQEKNDFNSLFNRLSDRTSYMSTFPHVYPLATNTNFYQQCVPDGTCDVIFTSMTTHWLDSLDVTFKDCVFFSSLKDDDHAVKQRVRQASERDWLQFLLHRARELKPGGLLVVLSLSAFDEYRQISCQKTKSCTESTENGPVKSCTERTGDGPVKSCIERTEDSPVYRQAIGGNDVRTDLDKAWRQLRDEGIISQEEFEGCVSPTDIRTAAEITAPFDETVPSPVRDAGLAMVHHDQVVYEFFAKHLWRDKLRSEGIDDRKFFAKMTTAAHRVWSETTFSNSLSSMRTAEEKNAILNRLYTDFEEGLWVVNPEDYNTDYILSRLVVQKQ